MKEFKLISTQPQTGCLNIPVFSTMTNADVVEKMLEKAEEQDYLITKRVFNYIQKLSETPDKIFFEMPENCPDCFVLAFGYKYHYKELFYFAAVILLALFFDSIYELIFG